LVVKAHFCIEDPAYLNLENQDFDGKVNLDTLIYLINQRYKENFIAIKEARQ
jgi:hypothetical protein